MNSLTKRIITGILGGALVIFLITFSKLTFWFFCGAVSVLSFLELVKLFRYSFKQPTTIFFSGLLILLWGSNLLLLLNTNTDLSRQFSYYTNILLGTFSIYSNVILYIIFSLGLLVYLFSKMNIKDYGVLVLGFFYFSLPWMLFYKMGAEASGMSHYILPLGILILIWLNDIGAFFVGKYLGKHKLFTRVSPSKTVEGVLGGALFTFAGAWVLFQRWSVVPWEKWITLATIISLFGVVGDLIESKMKRELGVKDSGNFLPGHGGFLDRFDSFVFVVLILHIASTLGL